MRTALLAAAAAALAGLALLAAAAYLYTARTPAPTAPPAPARVDGEAPAPAAGSGGFALTPHPEPRPLPALRFVDGDGRELSLADFRGRVVLLNIWATWCVPCRREMPALDRLQAQLGGPEFEVVALSIDRGGLEVVREFYDELGLEALAIYLDQPGEAMRALGLAGIPTTLLVDREGREIGRLVGPAEWDSPEVVGMIRRYLGNPSGAAAPGAGGGDAAGPRSEAPAATRRFAAGGPAPTALASSDWKDHTLVLKEMRP